MQTVGFIPVFYEAINPVFHMCKRSLSFQLFVNLSFDTTSISPYALNVTLFFWWLFFRNDLLMNHMSGL